MNKKNELQNDSVTNYVRQFQKIAEFEQQLREIEVTYQQMQADLSKLEQKINSYM